VEVEDAAVGSVGDDAKNKRTKVSQTAERDAMTRQVRMYPSRLQIFMASSA
jgi:hypothetical protein